jgi:hypothetical protein
MLFYTGGDTGSVDQENVARVDALLENAQDHY